MQIKPTSLNQVIEQFRVGGFVALLDSSQREGEADLLQAAQHVTGESINFMVTYARGLVTVATAPQRLRDLEIPLIEPQHCAPNMPRFTVPVDYTPATTTGVSAFDRAATIQALLDPDAQPQDFARPGHVFPLAAAEGGLTERAGHTEGAISLAKLAGLKPVVVMCEIMAPDGRMAAGDSLAEFLGTHSIPLITVAQIGRALEIEPAVSPR